MELHAAISNIIKSKGEDFLLDSKMVNALSDLNGFEEHPALKNVFRILQMDDLLAEILLINSPDIKERYITTIESKYGFDRSLITFVCESILFATGKSSETPLFISTTQNNNSTNTPTIPNQASAKKLDFSFMGIPLKGHEQNIYKKLKKKGFEANIINGEVNYMEGEFLNFDRCYLSISDPKSADEVNVSIQDPRTIDQLIRDYEYVCGYYEDMLGTPLYKDTYRDKEIIRHTHFEGSNGEIDIYAIIKEIYNRQYFKVQIVYNQGEIINHEPGFDPDDYPIETIREEYDKSKKENQSSEKTPKGCMLNILLITALGLACLL